MQYLLQMDFPYTGPFGDDFYKQMKDLAEDIATEKGLVYKLWTENQETQAEFFKVVVTIKPN